MPAPPADEYRTRLAARHATIDILSRRDRDVSHARLATFALGVAVAIAAWNTWFTGWLLVVPVLTFAWLAQRHDRVLRAHVLARRATAFYERGLARLEDRWAGTGEAGDRFRDDEHLYANDLDLFGRGSLFELLSIARTGAGEDTLARWLKEVAEPAEIAARHEAIRELTPALDLREALALAGSDVRTSVDPHAITAWGAAEPRLHGGGRLWAATITLATLVAVALLARDMIWPLVAVLAVRAWIEQRNRPAVEEVLHAADSAARDLVVLRLALQHLETATFTSPRLARLRAALDTDRAQASAAIATLARYVEMHDWAHNMAFGPIAAILMWDTHLAWAIEGWRARHGARIAAWLQAVGELEALSSISAYAYEHPADLYPVVIDDGSVRFEGVALGHPLLPAARMVRNDVTLGTPARLLVISGSNMSGKSTLLRTVGINAVLAGIGAPVRADALTLSSFTLGATLRIQDSLQEGRSRFYAEITRVRRLADAAHGARPLLFLLDELFHGTNSHDRLAGAAGVLRSLLEAGAVGLVTTHDLALTAITDALDGRAINVHFDDWFDGDDMRFDYRMKPGPVTRSNAIALMRAVGLDVEDAG